jgi:hypothetical protein
MSDETTRRQADERFEKALQQRSARDPRGFYRDLLRDLRSHDEAKFRRALAHFEQGLIPVVAREDSDPLAEWLDYGCLLAEFLEPGTPVRIDPGGRSRPYERPVPLEDLVLHLPADARRKAIAVGLPPELSPAQRATYDLLVRQGREIVQS